MSKRYPCPGYARWRFGIYGGFLIAGNILFTLLAAATSPEAPAVGQPEFRPGFSFHAFEHLHNYGQQAEAAAASGATVIYATGLGLDGYSGLPPAEDWEAHKTDSRAYAYRAKSLGIQVVLGYLCATSIVGLDTFDDHWPPELRGQLRTPPPEWLQQNSEGTTLPSWYGGNYHPACMNHPDWRTYQRFMVRAQVESGHDGIFFDNPTVHPQGCYCPYCMERFSAFLKEEGKHTANSSVDTLRRYAVGHPNDFKRFRCTIARDFFTAMRDYARSLNPNAVLTANNSLNQRDVLFSQCHDYAYNIPEMSRAEDWVVIEDMSSQPRVLPDGTVMECAPTYAQLHAVLHGKPLIAVTIAKNDYHTPPNLVCLAMCEAAACNTGYLLWSTWPEEQRERMATLVRPYTDWLRGHAELLYASRPRRDVLVFFPFRQWINTRECAVSPVARELTAANIPYEVVSEDRLGDALETSSVILLESRAICTPDEQSQVTAFEVKGGHVLEAEEKAWFASLKATVPNPSLRLHGPETVRGIVRDGPDTSLVFLYNLDIERISSFEDKTNPAHDVIVEVSVPFKPVKTVLHSSPGTSPVPVPFSTEETETGARIRIEAPPFPVGLILIIEKGTSG